MKKIIVLILISLSVVHASEISRCDVLAADPADKSKPPSVEGILFYKIDTEKALEACIKAVKDFPNEPRYGYQLGRAYEQSGNNKKAFEIYLETAKKGNIKAENKVGYWYFWGKGVTKNREKAFEWYMKAAKQGEVNSIERIGTSYYYGNGVTKDHIKAFEWYLKAAKKGDAGSQNSIGNMYLQGIGIGQDIDKAIEWYGKATEKISDYNSFRRKIGDMYYLGELVEVDYTKAIKWYIEYLNTNSPSIYHDDIMLHLKIAFMHYSGQGVEQNYKKAFDWIVKGAEIDGDSMLKYYSGRGNSYFKGKSSGYYSAKKDYKKAFEYYMKASGHGYRVDDFNWYMKSAKQGQDEAQRIVGDMYYRGKGVKEDLNKAFEWYMKSARQGNSFAQASVAEMYYDGEGVKKDYKQAIDWYILTAKKRSDYADIGLTRIQTILGDMYYLGEGVKRNYKKAFEWYTKANNTTIALEGKGSSVLQTAIGRMYYYGEGVRKSYRVAFEWYVKAAKQEYAKAQAFVGLAYLDGKGVKKNYIKAYAWLNTSQSGYSVADDEKLRRFVSRSISNLETKMSAQQIAIAQNYDPLKEHIDPKQANKSIKPSSSYVGTGFFINPRNLLTNNHVVEKCKKIELVDKEYKSEATVFALDPKNDLAILKTEKPNNTSLLFRAGKGIRIGHEVIVLGYPLGELLGSGIKLTTGDVSSMTGVLNDVTSMQITAPVQPGNSGGPLLDKSGNVVGVIYSRVEKSLSGRSVQNVNLAIKSNVAQMFLDTNSVDYDVAMSKSKKNVADIVDDVKGSIVQVVCYQ